MTEEAAQLVVTALGLRRAPTLRPQLAGLGLLAVLPLAAVSVAGAVMFSSGHDVVLLLVAAGASTASVGAAFVLGRSIAGRIERLSAASQALAPPVNESRSGSRRAANVRNRAYAIVHKSGARSPQGCINRAIACPSSPIVVSVEQACHAGGRGFDSRRSRSETRRTHSAARRPGLRTRIKVKC
ncbi:MAG: hypothetical protein ABIR67_05785 [Gaiellaceae bacterium]